MEMRVWRKIVLLHLALSKKRNEITNSRAFHFRLTHLLRLPFLSSVFFCSLELIFRNMNLLMSVQCMHSFISQHYAPILDETWEYRLRKKSLNLPVGMCILKSFTFNVISENWCHFLLFILFTSFMLEY